MNAFFSLIVTLFFLYVAFGFLLFFGQRSILYYPTPVIDHGFSEEVFSRDVNLSVIVLNPGSDEGALYFGGNAESMAMNASELSLTLPDVTVYLVNYRGYGGSGGAPTEAGLYSDALFLFDQISKRHDLMYLIGRSLGSGVVSYVAAEREVSKLVLITPFDSVVSVAGSLYPVYPVSLMVRDRYDSLSRAGSINAETLVLIAEHDQVIPRKNSERLIEGLVGISPKVHLLDDVDHNSISIHKHYYHLISNFL